MHGIILITLLIAGLGGGYFFGIASLFLLPFVLLSIALYYGYTLLFNREKVEKYLFEYSAISNLDFFGQDNSHGKLTHINYPEANTDNPRSNNPELL